MLDDIVILMWHWSGAARDRLRLLGRSPGERGESGEGVISTAIAVLIVAFLGAAAYVIFNNVLNTAGNNASSTVGNIGGGGQGN